MDAELCKVAFALGQYVKRAAEGLGPSFGPAMTQAGNSAPVTTGTNAAPPIRLLDRLGGVGKFLGGAATRIGKNPWGYSLGAAGVMAALPWLYHAYTANKGLAGRTMHGAGADVEDPNVPSIHPEMFGGTTDAYRQMWDKANTQQTRVNSDYLRNVQNMIAARYGVSPEMLQHQMSPMSPYARV